MVYAQLATEVCMFMWTITVNGSKKTADTPLEEILICRFTALGERNQPLTLVSYNGLIFSSSQYMAAVKAIGLIPEFAK